MAREIKVEISGREAATSAAEKKLARLEAKLAGSKGVVEAARELNRHWSGTGFFDRQDAADALALHDALNALDEGA